MSEQISREQHCREWKVVSPIHVKVRRHRGAPSRSRSQAEEVKACEGYAGASFSFIVILGFIILGIVNTPFISALVSGPPWRHTAPCKVGVLKKAISGGADIVAPSWFACCGDVQRYGCGDVLLGLGVSGHVVGWDEMR
jgi:hypothetical protein